MRIILNAPKLSRCGGIGRRKGLKIPRWQQRTGSSPVTGTKPEKSEPSFPNRKRVRIFCLYLILHYRSIKLRKPGRVIALLGLLIVCALLIAIDNLISH